MDEMLKPAVYILCLHILQKYTSGIILVLVKVLEFRNQLIHYNQRCHYDRVHYSKDAFSLYIKLSDQTKVFNLYWTLVI